MEEGKSRSILQFERRHVAPEKAPDSMPISMMLLRAEREPGPSQRGYQWASGGEPKRRRPLMKHRSRPSTSIEESLLREAEQVRKQAERLPPGEDRDRLLEDRDFLLKKARDAAHIDEWLTSPGLQPPR